MTEVDADLLERVLYLKLSMGTRRAVTIARHLNEAAEDPDEPVTVEAVQAVLDSQAFLYAWHQALADPEAVKQRRLRAARAVHQNIGWLDRICNPRLNEDKRTQMQGIALRLGLAGHTPQTQVAVGPNEEFLELAKRMLAPRNGAQKAIADETD